MALKPNKVNIVLQRGPRAFFVVGHGMHIAEASLTASNQFSIKSTNGVTVKQDETTKEITITIE